jgi:hypothetical protein
MLRIDVRKHALRPWHTPLQALAAAQPHKPSNKNSSGSRTSSRVSPWVDCAAVHAFVADNKHQHLQTRHSIHIFACSVPYTCTP